MLFQKLREDCAVFWQIWQGFLKIIYQTQERRNWLMSCGEASQMASVLSTNVCLHIINDKVEVFCGLAHDTPFVPSNCWTVSLKSFQNFGMLVEISTRDYNIVSVHGRAIAPSQNIFNKLLERWLTACCIKGSLLYSINFLRIYDHEFRTFLVKRHLRCPLIQFFWAVLLLAASQTARLAAVKIPA